MPFDASLPTAAVLAPRDRVLLLRDFLAGLPDERFRMDNLWQSRGGETILSREEFNIQGCGTAACILGWAAQLFEVDSDVQDEVNRLLGLNGYMSRELFMPLGWQGNTDLGGARFTRARAVAVLDHLLATSTPGTVDGEVDWSVSA